METPRILEVRTKVLKRNDELARELRAQFVAAGVFVTNLVSSPGAGKTSWLTLTLAKLKAAGARVAAIVGDVETDLDARRLAESGVPVRQIMTHGGCHLEADMIKDQLCGWSLAELDYLFVENVGNLVCPASWDLGEAFRVVLLAVTEGEEKPLKYPGLFNTADLALITKMDLAAACEFDRDAAIRNLAAVRPGMPWIETSARTGLGIDAWLRELQQRRSKLLAEPSS